MLPCARNAYAASERVPPVGICITNTRRRNFAFSRAAVSDGGKSLDMAHNNRPAPIRQEAAPSRLGRRAEVVGRNYGLAGWIGPADGGRAH